MATLAKIKASRDVVMATPPLALVGVVSSTDHVAFGFTIGDIAREKENRCCLAAVFSTSQTCAMPLTLRSTMGAMCGIATTPYASHLHHILWREGRRCCPALVAPATGNFVDARP